MSSIAPLPSDTDLEAITPIGNILWSSGSRSVKNIVAQTSRQVYCVDKALPPHVHRLQGFNKKRSFLGSSMYNSTSVVLKVLPYGWNYWSEDLPRMDNDPNWSLMVHGWASELCFTISFFINKNSIVGLLSVSFCRTSQPGKLPPLTSPRQFEQVNASFC